MRTLCSTLAVAMGLLVAVPAATAFTISAEPSCGSYRVYSYYFTSSALLPDLDVKVSSSALLPDLTLKLVNSPDSADLVLRDDIPEGLSAPDMRVCKSTSPLSGVVIKVSATSLLPDITVELSDSPLLPDYTLFVDSRAFSEEEAAALFAVIWERNRRKGR